MLNKMRNTQGFTLIELLIVVAIIGILAAIAIPQFSQYRIKGYNTAAATDLGNVKLAESSFNTDSGGVFASTVALAVAAGVVTPGTGVPGLGAIATGPIQAPINVAAATIGTFPSVLTSMNFGISNGVSIGINTTAANGTAYVAGASHAQGNAAYYFDSDGTAVKKLVAGKAVGAVLPAIPASLTSADDLVPDPGTYIAM